MMAKGMIYFVLILFSAIFMIASLIIALVKYSGNGRGAWKWLIGFFIGLIAFASVIFLLTRGVITKTKNFVENISEMGIDQMNVLDSLNKINQISADSILQSEQVSTLIAMEPEAYKGIAPSQFYSYLGFRDYFRLPLRYPYALHCMDSLGNAELFDEESVTQFDVNDNGEVSSNINTIITFAFNKDLLIGTRIKTEGKRHSIIYFAYDFNAKKQKEFKTEVELINFAKAKGFEKEIDFYTCKRYYESF